jgi:hypothetical protein
MNVKHMTFITNDSKIMFILLRMTECVQSLKIIKRIFFFSKKMLKFIHVKMLHKPHIYCSRSEIKYEFYNSKFTLH